MLLCFYELRNPYLPVLFDSFFVIFGSIKCVSSILDFSDDFQDFCKIILKKPKVFSPTIIIIWMVWINILSTIIFCQTKISCVCWKLACNIIFLLDFNIYHRCNHICIFIGISITLLNQQIYRNL